MNCLRTVVKVVAGVGSAALLVGCPAAPSRVFRNPSMTATFDAKSISHDEMKSIDEGVKKTGATVGDDNVTYQYRFSDKEYKPEDLAAILVAWHRAITDIRNAAGTPIAANNAISIQLTYLSSNANSNSDAHVFIEPFPKGAALFLDTALPGPGRKIEGHVELNATGGFRTDLPFSFIRSTNRIFFHTVYGGSTRYFYYDTERQTQEEVPAQSSKDWGIFMQTGALPAK